MFSFRYLNGPSQNKVLGLVQALLYCNVREESGNHGSPELHRVIPQGAIQPGRRTSEGGLPLGTTRYYLIQVIRPLAGFAAEESAWSKGIKSHPG